MEYILELEFEEFEELIKYAYKKKEEKELWDLYLVNFSRMDKSNYETFEDYKRRVKSYYPITEKIASVEDVMEEMKDVIEIFKRKEENNGNF